MINKKGQGIVEYALILAFVVGIAMITLKGVNLGSAVIGVFDDVAAFLGGETVAVTAGMVCPQ